jgi:hypothetical protein
MAFEERLTLLVERVQAEYDEYMKNVLTLDSKCIVKEARKIAVMEEVLSQIASGIIDHPYDVEILLTFDQPLAASYGHWENNSGEDAFMEGIAASMSGFLTVTRDELAEKMGRYDSLTPEEQERIMEYHNHELAVFDHLQEQEFREKYIEELTQTIQKEFAAFRAYMEINHATDQPYYEDTKAIRDGLLDFDRYTTQQLSALTKVYGILSSVYNGLDSMRLVHADEKEAIRSTVIAMADSIIESDRSRQEAQEEPEPDEDDELDR